MSEDGSFEIINKKSDGTDTKKNDNFKSDKNVSLIAGVVPPPSALPTFVTSSGTSTSASNMFHSNAFSPEIPESTTQSELTFSDNSATYNTRDDSIGTIGTSLFGWVKDTVGNKGSNLLNKVAEKAKNSVGSVITTLDPQMKDFISSSHDFQLIVTSEKEVEVSSIREVFQNGFNKISVRGLEVEEINFAKQIVGFESASKAAISKIETIRSQNSFNGPIIAVQNFIAEICEEKWYDLDLILLHDLERGIHLETYSQMIPFPSSIINVTKEDTPNDYVHIDTGFSVTISQIMGNNLQVHPSEWQEILTGVSRRQRILSAAKVLVNLYKNTLL